MLNLEELRKLHEELRLAGRPRNALLGAPDKFLNYLLPVLRNEKPPLPQASLDEWQGFLSLLNCHGIFPFLYWQIKRLPEDLQPPQEIISCLKDAFRENVVRSLQMERQLEQVQAAFSKEGIQVLVLKGPALAKLVYPDPGLRPSNDLDLLVHPKQVQAARKILTLLGYSCKSHRFETLYDLEIEERFKSPEKYTSLIELHWDIHGFFGIKKRGGIEELFSRAVRVGSFDTLHPVDAFMHAALHMAMMHNREITLRWILDCAFLARRLAAPHDWQVLQERSRDWKARLAVEYSIKMAELWFGVNPPQPFNNFSTWPLPTKAERQAWRDITLRHKNLISLFRIRGASSLTKILRFVFPPPDCVKETFPFDHIWQLPRAYLRRWKRWLNYDV